MTLTKRYRIIWNDKKEMICDPCADYSGTATVVGEGMNYFESDSMKDIEDKIKNLHLKSINI